MSQPPKVTLEDLLRLKRAERPTPEFWEGFEKELRQKQLTALVQKRRWWDDVPVWLGRRFYLPVGATAVIAFTLVSVRYSTPGSVAQIENRAPQIVAADPAVEILPTTVVEQTAARDEGPVARQPVSIAAVRPEVIAPEVKPAAEEISPSARSIANNLARLELDEPELVNAVIGSRLSSPARVQTASLAQSGAAAVGSGDTTHHYRLIARYADRSLSPAPAAPALVRERLARRLGDDLGESISRIGVQGSKVSLKF